MLTSGKKNPTMMVTNMSISRLKTVVHKPIHSVHTASQHIFLTSFYRSTAYLITHYLMLDNS